MDDKSFRLAKEDYFIKKFKPKLNNKWNDIAAETMTSMTSQLTIVIIII